jgi:hypothetical protein
MEPLFALLAELGAVPDGALPVPATGLALPVTPAPGAVAAPGRELREGVPSALIR